tara:strand:- start:164 stop:631 length:468 start_codon:yes stop_codon:yes gene_type:complete
MAKLVVPKNALKAKVGNGGFSKENIAKAQSALEQNDIDFRPIANDYLKEMSAIAGQYEPDKPKETLLGVLDPLMQLRAQGTLFHYPSLTMVSDIVVDFLDFHEKMDGQIIEIIRAYIQAARLILDREIKNAEDPICKAFTNELRAVCDRYNNKSK